MYVHGIIYTVLHLYNADGGIHRADCDMAKPPYYQGTFNIKIMGKVLQWELRGCCDINMPCNEAL